MSDYDEVRANLAVAIANVVAPTMKDDTDGHAVMLSTYVCVIEWMDDDGQHWLSRIDGPGMTSWKRSGMLHDALHGDWDED